MKHDAEREAELHHFLRQYGRKAGARKATKGSGDPNDRHYCRKAERRFSKMRPEEIDRLLREA